MDRIRQAVTRARTGNNGDAKTATTHPALRKAAPKVVQQSDQSLNAASERFPLIECNFENFGEHRIISNEQDPVLNAYRVLRTRVLQKMEKSGWKTLAVVSPGSGAGKTVTAINLAIAMSSKAGINPVLADLDFYRPSIARYLGMSEFPSVLDYFESKKNLDDVTVRMGVPNLLVMPNERVTRQGAEFLTSGHADRLIQTATTDYQSRVVIFDMSPILGCDDTIAFLPKVDCVLLIAASGQTRVPELKEARRILGKTNVIGTVLNKSPSALMPNQYY
ncbi:MAG: chromosome partitioning protein [Hyphococcus sp.]|nr:MAG: chromosome partitioning protein [Marinicaulis sp.]